MTNVNAMLYFDELLEEVLFKVRLQVVVVCHSGNALVT